MYEGDVIGSEFKVVAIVAAFNEQDIIAQCLRHLIREGVSVYLIDHSSTDATVAEAQPFLGRGLLHIESFPNDSGFAPELRDRFCWTQLLQRKEMLARILDADWLIHHDADEFRQSPWEHLSLKEAIRAVDAAGFNAIDFDVYQFQPVHDTFAQGDDPLVAFQYFDRTESFDRLQIRAWKKNPAVRLVPSGGHEASFPERHVFPIPFLLRHYPIRNQSHGVKKIFVDRRPRFDESERAMGWHRQYNEVGDNVEFIKNPKNLRCFDLNAARFDLLLRNRQTEELRSTLAATQVQLDAVSHDLAWYRHEWSKREHELVTSIAAVEKLESVVTAIQTQNGSLRAQLASAEHELATLRAELHAVHEATAEQVRQIEALRSSLSWRMTAPARDVLKRLRGY